MNSRQLHSKRRRLTREITYLHNLITDREMAIANYAYESDLPILHQELKDAKFDLQEAIEEDLNQEGLK